MHFRVRKPWRKTVRSHRKYKQATDDSQQSFAIAGANLMLTGANKIIIIIVTIIILIIVIEASDSFCLE